MQLYGNTNLADLSMTKLTTKQKQHSTRILLHHWHHAMKWKKTAIANMVVAATSLVIDRYLSPLVIAYLLTTLQNGTITLETSIWMIAIYFVLILSSEVIGYRITLFLMWTMQVKGARSMYEDAYNKTTAHSLQFFNNTFAGSLVSQTNKLGKAFMDFWNLVIYKLVFILTSLIATLIGVGLISWPYAIVLFVLTVIFAVATYYGNRFLRPYFVKRSRNYSKLSAQLADSFSNMMTVKIEGHEAHERALFSKVSSSVLDSELATRNMFIKTSSVYSAITATMKIAALVVAILLVQQHVISAGLVYLCLIYTFNLLEEIWNIHSVMRDYHQIIADSEEMTDIMDQEPDVTNTSRKSLHVTAGAIAINDMSYAYKDGLPLFDNFSLTIPAKQRVGLVGVSGSGKTTITKLIMRLMDTDAGSITIDGTAIQTVSQRSLRKHIAYVPQEPLLFHRSLRDNIRYSKPGATDDQIIAAAKRAQAYDFIKNLPEGLDTLVGERGVKLSGGQRQRIAIARAILKDAPIIILDEATSALDSESEHAIQIALGELWRGKTTLVIAHRLSTIAKLDRIIVLDNGAIIEDGTHNQLLANDKTYATLWKHQSGGFIEE